MMKKSKYPEDEAPVQTGLYQNKCICKVSDSTNGPAGKQYETPQIPNTNHSQLWTNTEYLNMCDTSSTVIWADYYLWGPLPYHIFLYVYLWS